MGNPQLDFWPCVQRSDGCWLWTGRTDEDGYGKYRLRMRELRAHRYSYALAYGPVPPGLLVCHRCDNPPCVRPGHLFLGTPLDNTRDMIAKGRRVANPPPLARPWKVDSGVMATVVALRAQGCTQAQIAAEVGLSQPYVSKLLRRVL